MSVTKSAVYTEANYSNQWVNNFDQEGFTSPPNCCASFGCSNEEIGDTETVFDTCLSQNVVATCTRFEGTTTKTREFSGTVNRATNCASGDGWSICKDCCNPSISCPPLAINLRFPVGTVDGNDSVWSRESTSPCEYGNTDDPFTSETFYVYFFDYFNPGTDACEFSFSVNVGLDDTPVDPDNPLDSTPFNADFEAIFDGFTIISHREGFIGGDPLRPWSYDQTVVLSFS